MRKLAFFLMMCLFVVQTWAQNKTVTGKVTDDKGNALAGVNVSARSKKVTPAVTDANGHFSISLPPGIEQLEVTFVGYANEFIKLAGKTEVTVQLTSNAASLSEIVVVGYGTQKKRETTGSIAVVKGDALADKPVQSFDAALAGRATGVQVTVPSGVLNSPPVFRIRGTNSISLSSYPLVVVDGVVTTTGDVSVTSAAGNALSSINPSDIESIDVAKDAAATAIYGSRAANGVVFITTKKGRSGKPKATYDGWVGWTKAFRLPDLMNAFEYTDYKNTAVANANAIRPNSVTNTKFALTNGPDGQPINTNWFDYVYRTGISQSHNISVAGGGENTSYYFSAGYTDQEGLIKKNDYKRMNVLLNVDSRINRVITIGGKLSYSNEKNLAAVSSGSLAGEAYGTAGLARTALVNAPNISPYLNDGSYNIGAQYIGPMSNLASGNQVGFYNPVIILDKNRENNELDHIQSNAYLQVKPLNWVSLKTLYGVDNINSDNDIFYNPLHGPGQGAIGEAIGIFRKRKTWVWTNTAQFDYTFADKHSVSLLVGNEQQRNTVTGYGIDRQGLTDNAYTLIQAGYTLNNSTSNAFGENYLLSNFGRLNYSFDKKYFISGNIRSDEYSALGEKKGTFWGASAGWEITKENFWASSGLGKVFSSFKLRGSYGKVGNIAGINDYAIFSTFGSGLYGGAPSLSYSQAGNDKLTWETSKKTDVGFNFGLFNDRLTGEFTYYNNNIDNLVLSVPQAPSAGLPTNILQNVGTMYNRGLEIGLNATPVQGKDFSWNTNFNFTYNVNKVTSLAPGLNEILYLTGSSTGSGTTGENVNRTAPGYSIGYLYVVRTAGVDTAAGRRVFLDKAGTPVTYQHIVPTGAPNWAKADGTAYLNPSDASGQTKQVTQAYDAVMYKNTQPKYYGGWDNSFSYKGFDVNVLLTYQLGFSVSYGTNAGLHDQRYWNNTRDVLNYWKKGGDRTNIVRPIYGDNVSYGNTIPLDINVFKGDFVKLKNLSLGYSLPRTLLERSKITSARVYVSAQNLAIITDYPGPDPEVASNGNASFGQGSDRNTAPNARTFTVGLKVGF